MFGAKPSQCRRFLPSALTGLCLMGMMSWTAAATFYRLDVTQHDDHYRMVADVHLDASPAEVYAALTDFSEYPHINPNVRVSRVVRQPDAHTQLVYIESVSCVAIFCETIKQLQKFTEPDTRDILVVTLPDGSNVKYGSSSWHLEAEAGGTRLHWQADIEPDFWVPPFIGPRAIVEQLRSQALACMQDIERRSLQHWASGSRMSL